jgi:hypothetical protein
MLKTIAPVSVALILVLTSCRSVPDSAMLESFEQHRAALEELTEMATRDSLSCPIPKVGAAACVSPARIAHYQALLTSAHVFAISPQWERGYVLFPSVQESALLAMHSHVRGYAFAARSPLLPTTGDTADEVGENPIAFKAIGGHWYLYFSA